MIPPTFADEALDGFVAANRRYVARVDGGVVRSTAVRRRPGGPGHRRRLRATTRRSPAWSVPAWQRAAPAETCSPPLRRPGLPGGQGRRAGRRRAAQLRQLCRRRAALRPGPGAAERRGHRNPHRAGHGRHRQRPADEIEKRRGIAGDLTVFKIAGRRRGGGTGPGRGGAAGPLRPTTAPARWAWPSPAALCPARRSRCSPCPSGKLSLGLGIHGEPGISEHAMPTASELAELLVERLLQERPDGAGNTRGADPQRPGHRQVRGTLRALRQDREASHRRRAGDGGARMRRTGHQPGYVRAVPDSASGWTTNWRSIGPLPPTRPPSAKGTSRRVSPAICGARHRQRRSTCTGSQRGIPGPCRHRGGGVEGGPGRRRRT